MIIDLIKSNHTFCSYGKTSDSSGGVDETDLFVMGKNQQTSVEFVGAQKVNIQQSRFNNLKEACKILCLINK